MCDFYSRYGICKFGPNCKYDHPIRTYTYGLSASSMAEVPTAWHLSSILPEPPVLTLPLETAANGSSGVSRRISLSESQHATAGDENDDEES